MRARLYVEAHGELQAHIRQRTDQWDEADVDPDANGFDYLPDQGLVLDATTLGTVLEQTTTDATTHLNLNRPPGGGTYDVVRIDWLGSQPSDLAVRRLTLKLDPDTGAGQEVVTWKCLLMALTRQVGEDGTDTTYYELSPISEAATAVAGGAAADVLFDFTTILPRPLQWHPVGSESPVPVTYVFVWGVKADGSLAANTGLLAGGGSLTTGSPIGVSGVQLTDSSNQSGAYDIVSTGLDVPRIEIEAGSYSAATITWSSGNLFNLGAAVTSGTVVEFTLLDHTPEGTTVTAEVRNDADTAWVAFADGDTTDDLAGVTPKQTYSIRVTLTPNGAGDLTPILRAVGIREITTLDVSETAEVVTRGTGFNPKTLEGQPENVTIRILRDGVRDWEDFATRIAAEFTVSEVYFRVFVGADDLPRSAWMLRWEGVILDQHGEGGALVFDCVCPLALLDAEIPKAVDLGGGSWEWQHPSYNPATYKAIYEDLIDVWGELPGRHRGEGVTSTTQVSRDLDRSEVRQAVNQIARTQGMTVISSQGRVVARDVHQRRGIVAFFPLEEIAQGNVTPGYQQRVPRYVVPFNYNAERGEFDDILVRTHGPSLLAFRRVPLKPEDRADDDFGKWVQDATTATNVALNVVDTLGAGMIIVPFSSERAHPELEPGDPVTVVTDRLALKDPNNPARQLKGELAVYGVVLEVNDMWGRQLVVWGRDLNDIISAENQGTVDVTIAAPTGLAVVDNAVFRHDPAVDLFRSRAEISWTDSTSPSVVHHEVQFRESSSDPWSDTFIVPNGVEELFIFPVQGDSRIGGTNDTWETRVRARAESGAVSPWTTTTDADATVLFSGDRQAYDTSAVFTRMFGRKGTSVTSSPYTVLDDDNVLECGSGASVLNLPAIGAAYRGREIMVVNFSGGNVTPTANGSDTINGGASMTVATGTHVHVRLPETGTDWKAY